MTEFHFTNDYAAGFFTGKGLHERLEAEGKTELVLTILNIRKDPFSDAKEQWVLSFGVGEQELRVKPQLGRPLFEAFGNSSNGWLNRQIAIWPDWITWKSKSEDDPGEGWTIRSRPIPGNSYAKATGGTPAVIDKPKSDFDDAIPF